MNWLSNLWFDIKLSWWSSRWERQYRRDMELYWSEELVRLREKGL